MSTTTGRVTIINRRSAELTRSLDGTGELLLTLAVDAFEPQSRAWFAGPPLPEAAARGVPVLADTRLLVVDDEVTVELDIALGQWVDRPAMPELSRRDAVVASGPQVHVFGLDGAGEPEHLIYHADGSTWTEGAALPAYLPQHRRTRYLPVPGSGNLVVLGLIGDPLRPEVYDLASDAWGLLPPPPIATWDQAPAVLGGQIWLAGGNLVKFENGEPRSASRTGETLVYDGASNQWERLPEEMPTARSGGFIFASGGEVFVLGGTHVGKTGVD